MGKNNNPTGKGGFKDHPEIAQHGLWDPEHSFKTWMQKFKRMTVKDFRDYEKDKPEDKRTVAESIAYARVHAARSDATEYDRVANRTEGYPVQPEETKTVSEYDNLTIEQLYDRRQELDRKLKGTTGSVNRGEQKNSTGRGK